MLNAALLDSGVPSNPCLARRSITLGFASIALCVYLLLSLLVRTPVLLDLGAPQSIKTFTTPITSAKTLLPGEVVLAGSGRTLLNPGPRRWLPTTREPVFETFRYPSQLKMNQTQSFKRSPPLRPPHKAAP